MSLIVAESGGTVRFSVKVQARAGREEIVGVQGGKLKVRVTAPPLEGRANHAVTVLLARRLHVSRPSVKIAAGHRVPLKVLEVSGITAAELLKRLGLGSGLR